MKRRTSTIIFVVFIIILLAALFFAYSYYLFANNQDDYTVEETLSIANWNLQIFGDAKANNTQLMNLYAEKISHYNIVFLQEIRDKDGSSFITLCSMLPEYNCLISSRAGRSSSKEQYGVIYLKKFNVTLKDYNPDIMDRWERFPIRADIYYKNYSLSIYNIHTKPDNVSLEIKNLESLIDSENTQDNIRNMRNTIILGDLNADCYYYNPYSRNEFLDWRWIIGNDADTTSGNSNCAYDRIIMNNDAYNEYIQSGIDTTNIDEKVSDHYLIWTLIRDNDYQKDKTFKAFLSSIFT